MPEDELGLEDLLAGDVAAKVAESDALMEEVKANKKPPAPGLTRKPDHEGFTGQRISQHLQVKAGGGVDGMGILERLEAKLDRLIEAMEKIGGIADGFAEGFAAAEPPPEEKILQAVRATGPAPALISADDLNFDDPMQLMGPEKVQDMIGALSDLGIEAPRLAAEPAQPVKRRGRPPKNPQPAPVDYVLESLEDIGQPAAAAPTRVVLDDLPLGLVAQATGSDDGGLGDFDDLFKDL